MKWKLHLRKDVATWWNGKTWRKIQRQEMIRRRSRGSTVERGAQEEKHWERQGVSTMSRCKWQWYTLKWGMWLATGNGIKDYMRKEWTKKKGTIKVRFSRSSDICRFKRVTGNHSHFLPSTHFQRRHHHHHHFNPSLLSVTYLNCLSLFPSQTRHFPFLSITFSSFSNPSLPELDSLPQSIHLHCSLFTTLLSPPMIYILFCLFLLISVSSDDHKTERAWILCSPRPCTKS